MAFKVGDKVIWVDRNRDNTSTLHEGVITKLGNPGKSSATVYIDGNHKLSDQRYAAFMWPDCEESRQLCNDIIATSIKHQQEDKELLTRQLELGNKFVREGKK